jgi:hypothetical protein
MQTKAFTGTRLSAAQKATMVSRVSRKSVMPVRATAAPAKEEMVDEMGFKLMRKGVKVAANDTILTPRYAHSPAVCMTVDNSSDVFGCRIAPLPHVPHIA